MSVPSSTLAILFDPETMEKVGLVVIADAKQGKEWWDRHSSHERAVLVGSQDEFCTLVAAGSPHCEGFC